MIQSDDFSNGLKPLITSKNSMDVSTENSALKCYLRLGDSEIPVDSVGWEGRKTPGDPVEFGSFSDPTTRLLRSFG